MFLQRCFSKLLLRFGDAVLSSRASPSFISAWLHVSIYELTYRVWPSFGRHTRNHLSTVATVNSEILARRLDDGVSKRFGHANEAVRDVLLYEAEMLAKAGKRTMNVFIVKVALAAPERTVHAGRHAGHRTAARKCDLRAADDARWVQGKRRKGDGWRS